MPKGECDMSSTNKENNPMSEYLLKLQLIITNTEFKNKTEAYKYETLESKLAGEAYVRAVNKTDIFESYEYDKADIYNSLIGMGIDQNQAMKMIDNYILIPQRCKEVLLERKRHELIANYNEPNKYYKDLTGVPSSMDDEVSIQDEFYEIYSSDIAIHRGMSIHDMPIKYQELYMNSKYYQETLDRYPNLTYLKYIGSNKIPIEVSRPAKDGAILRINTSKLFTYNNIFGNITVNPQLIHLFTNVYSETRDYVYNTLKGDFSSIYTNYDSFMRFLTIYLSIGNTLNELMKESNSLIHMNNVTANNFFVLYGLPSVITEGESMINFLKKFRLILMDKGTNTVYRVKDLIGYDHTDIYSLIMVKQQAFENGVPIYVIDENGNKIPKQRIVFRRSGVADDNVSYFTFKNERSEYSLEEITSKDPRWWNGRDVDKMLTEMNYTLSNSKYIQLSTHMSMEDIFYQTSILLRGLLDRKQETLYTTININYSINGSSEMSVFEAIVVLVTLMNWKMKDAIGRSVSGDLYIPNGTYNGQPACVDELFNGLNTNGSPKDLILGQPFKITSFNFDIKDNDSEFYESLNNTKFIDPEIFMSMVDKVITMEDNNVGKILMSDVKNIWNYLRDKLLQSSTIEEFREVTDVYKHLFLVDPLRKWYTDSYYDASAIICEEFSIIPNEYLALCDFFIEGHDDFTIIKDHHIYPISLFNILNKNVNDIMITDNLPFTDESFLQLFYQQLDDYENSEIQTTSRLSSTIKTKYKDIIKSKIMLDTNNTEYGPKTMEALLFRQDPKLYRTLLDMKSDDNAMIMIQRSIVKALETYTESQLVGLQYKTIGLDEYFRILKEVITYFKSYMVEFTSEEFVYIFGGIFDNGGNSDMLKLFDEISHLKVRMIPKDSLTLYDVSYSKMKLKMSDHNEQMFHDEGIFRYRAPLSKFQSLGYDVWYDDGKKITKTAPDIDGDTKVVADIVRDKEQSTILTPAYKIIINVEKIKNPLSHYYGNTR